MPRPKLYRHSLQLRVGQLERALVAYYSHKYERPQPDIVRGMIKQYVRADANFDAEAFEEYVKQALAPEQEPDVAEETQRRVAEFTASLMTRS